MRRLPLLLVMVCALARGVGCKGKSVDPALLAQVKTRAAAFEPMLAKIKAIPAAPPPVATASIPTGALFSLDNRPGDNTPKPYLIIHAEDLASPPKYYVAEGVKLRLSGSGALAGCVSGLADSKEPEKGGISQYTLIACTDFKFAFVVKTTEYVAPKYTGTDKDKSAGTMTEHFTPGHVSAEVTIYDLSDSHAAGGFHFHAESSAAPSVEGGFTGALDRDLIKNAEEAAQAGFTAALRGTSTTTPAAKPVKKK